MRLAQTSSCFWGKSENGKSENGIWNTSDKYVAHYRDKCLE